MEKWKHITLSLLQMLVIVLLSITAGSYIVEEFNLVPVKANVYLYFSAGFFVGFMFLLVCFRVLEVIIRNIFYACFGAVLITGGLGVKSFYDGGVSGYIGDIDVTYFVLYVSFFVMVIIALLLCYNDYTDKEGNILCTDGKIHVFTNLGTTHTPRSVNVAKVAVKEKRIPMLGVNYGLPLVMMIFEVLNNPYSYFVQFMYYCVNNAFVALFIMGYLIEYWNVTIGYAFLVAIVVFFATEEISFRYKLCTDATACTNWGITKYPDTWMMMCIFLLCIRGLYENSNVLVCDDVLFGVFILLCAIGFELIAPQFGIMMSGLIGFDVILSFICGNVENACKLMLYFGVLVIGMLVTAHICGGMFQNKAKVRQDIEGCESGGKLSFGYNGIALRDINKIDTKHIEEITTKNIRILVGSFFFIIVSVLTSGIGKWNSFLTLQLGILFAGGFMLTYFLSTNGTGKMMLTRFLAPAFVLSKIVWMGAAAYELQIYDGSIVGCLRIMFACYMVLTGIPMHIQWFKKYNYASVKAVLNVWFQKTDIVFGAGDYDCCSEYNKVVLQNGVENIQVSDEISCTAVWIYGTGEYACKIYENVKDKVEIKGFIDSNPEKWKECIGEYKIYSPQQVAKIQQEKEGIVIGSNMTAGIFGIYFMCNEYRLINVIQITD